MKVSRRCLLVTIAAPALSTSSQTFAQQSRPNIVVPLMDNLGLRRVGDLRRRIKATPNIDKLAEEGMRLLNFNVEAQRTPSRFALMTGCLSIRSGTYEVPIGGVDADWASDFL